MSAFALVLVLLAQTRIASDVEIRQMEEEARKASGFQAQVAARINLGELRRERNEPDAAQREFEAALQLARAERADARHDHDPARYADACGWSGVALAGLERGVEALSILEEGVRYDAGSPQLWNLYSVAMYRLRRLDNAIGAARISVDLAERKITSRATVHELLTLNVQRFALAEGLLDLHDARATTEAQGVLKKINESLDSDAFRKLRKTIGEREEFQIVTAATTDSGVYLSVFNRSHMRLAHLYEAGGSTEEARSEYEAVLRQRSDESEALAGLARLAADPKERERRLVESLDANPFSSAVIAEYEQLVAAGNATPAKDTGSAGSRVRMAVQQLHDRDFRRARATVQSLIDAHPHNDVLLSLFARVELESGDLAAARDAIAKISDEVSRAELERVLNSNPSDRPWFLENPAEVVDDPSEYDLRIVLTLLGKNELSASDRATLDSEEFVGDAIFDAPEGGTINGVPFRLQTPVPASARTLRLVYRILGATVVDGRDALLIEPLRAEVAK